MVCKNLEKRGRKSKSKEASHDDLVDSGTFAYVITIRSNTFCLQPIRNRTSNPVGNAFGNILIGAIDARKRLF